MFSLVGWVGVQECNIMYEYVMVGLMERSEEGEDRKGGGGP